MIKKCILFLLISINLLYFNLCYCQPGLTWAKQMGGTSTDRGHSVAVDDSGNVYTRGSFWYAGDFDPGQGVYTLYAPGGMGGAFISKLDAAGNFVWAKILGGPVQNDDGYGIVVDNKGYVYTVGYFTGTVDFDPGPGVYNMTANGSVDIFVIKFDVAGNFIWAKQLGGAGDNYGYGIGVDKEGNVYTSGYFSDTADFDPGPGTYNLIAPAGGGNAFVSKLDSSGNFVWAKDLGGVTSAWSDGLTIDRNQYVYTTGWFLGTGDFDPGPGSFNLTSTGVADIFISKLDTGGNFVWAKNIGGTSANYGLAITTDANGNILTTGLFDGTTDFDPNAGAYSLTSVGGDDIFISKLDSSGNFVWAKGIGGTGFDRGQAIAADINGNVYTTGFFENTADFDPGPGIYNLTSAGAMDVFVSELDPAGNFVCAGRMGGPNPEGDVGWGMTVDKTGNVYVTGQFAGTADFDPGPAVFNLVATGVINIFTGKYLSCSAAEALPVAAFSANDTSFCGNNCIDFSDLSNSASSWQWSFPGAIPDTSTNENPAGVCYDSSGLYDVILIATNANGADTLRKVQYITVNSLLTDSVNISSPSDTVCVGSMVIFTATPANGGTTPHYQWQVNGVNAGTDSSVYATGALNNNDIVTCIITSGASCVTKASDTSNPVIVAMYPPVQAGTITAVPDTICKGSQAILSVSGNSATVQWQSSFTTGNFTGINGADSAIYNSGALQNTYYREYVGNGVCGDTSATVKLMVNPIPLPLPSANDTLICSGDSTQICVSDTFSSYNWNTGDNTSCTYVNAAGGYWLTVTGANGCAAISNHANIAVYPVPSVSIIVQGDTLSSFGQVSYQWLYQDTAITGATSSVYIARNTGNYSVQVTDVNGCKTNSTEVDVTSAGINNLLPDEFEIYPNPAAGWLYLNYAGQQGGNYLLTIFNTMGEKVKEESLNFKEGGTAVVNIAPLPKAVYLLQLLSGQQSWIKRIIIQ